MNSRENPFSTERIESLAFRFPDRMTWESFMERLDAQQYCGAIVGPAGSGKSVLLTQLAPRLEALGFEPQLFQLRPESGMREKERLCEAVRQVRRPGFILLDGAEHLSTRQWLPVRGAGSQAAGFIVTVHRVSRLPAVLECDTSVRLLEELVHELSGGELPRNEAELLLSRHRGDLRAVFQELRERWYEE